MQQRELTFQPETETGRELVYSEYTSCERSIHVLLQGNNLPQHKFLLSAYREIVSHYLSGANLRSPVDFLQHVTQRLEEISRGNHFTIADYKAMGFHVLLRNTDAYFLLTSRRDHVFFHEHGESTPLSESGLEGVEQVLVDESHLQEELFPESLRDCFALYRIDAHVYAGRDIVLGCGEEDRGTVLEILNDPLWLQAADRRNTYPSKFIARKVLVLRFEETFAGAALSTTPSGGLGWRRVAVGLAGAAALVVLATVIVRNQAVMPWGDSENGTALMEMPVDSEVRHQSDAGESVGGATGETEAALTAAEVSEPAATYADTRLVENWSKTFRDAVTSSPAAYDDRVVFGCRDGHVYALQRGTGVTLWEFDAGAGVGASPELAGDRVVAANYAGSVFALSRDDGSQLWKTTLPAKIVASPRICGDRILVGCYDGYAYCLSAADGSKLWKYGTGAKIRATAGVFGEVFVVASYDGVLYALAAENGAEHWRYRIGGNIAGSPVVYNDVVIVGAPDGAVYAVDTADGRLRWKHRTGAAIRSTAAVADGRIYIGSNDRHVYCLNAEDGKLEWRYKTGGIVLSSPVVRGGVVYAGSYDGYLYCLRAENGELVDRFLSEGEIYSSPVADKNGVYFGNNKGRFIALGHTAKDAS
jgi:outer membrane protein assembly factor BamB